MSFTNLHRTLGTLTQPVERQAITSLWSPKMLRAWPAKARAATCMTHGSNSPLILNMFGIINRRP